MDPQSRTDIVSADADPAGLSGGLFSPVKHGFRSALKWVIDARNRTRTSSLALSPLTPTFREEDHGVYVETIDLALKGPDDVRNIALTGSYGAGKSSILKEVASRHKGKVVQVSFSTLGIKEVTTATLDKDGKPMPPLSQTNRIQKEIVKQILYQEKPWRTPNSRYRRITNPNWFYEACFALLLAIPLAAAIHLTGWVPKFWDLVWPEQPWIKSFWITLPACAGFLYSCLVRFRGRLSIEKLTAAGATVSLARSAESYFDEHLDEIVYFFEATGKTVVLLEDIDRFEDPHIFESLRALNILLNGAGQLRGRPIRFVYAIKDSIFDELGLIAAREALGDVNPSLKDPVVSELARTNRTKFFDLVVPVVPFITHRTARDLMAKEMSEAGAEIEKALTVLAGRHVPDMRLIKNARNEFLVFKEKVFGGENPLRLDENALYAMMLYKGTHLSDFERIKSGTSDLDLLYRDYRLIVSDSMSRLDREERTLRDQLERLDSVSSRSTRLGEKLLQRTSELAQMAGLPKDSMRITFSGQSKLASDLSEAPFWKEFLSSDEELTVDFRNPSNPYGSTLTLTIGKDAMARLLGEPVVQKDWEVADRRGLLGRLERVRDDRHRIAHASMREIFARTDLKIESGDVNKSFRELSEERLPAELARQLVAEGYIDRNFALYAATYHALQVSARALNFIIHVVEQGGLDENFELGPADIEAVLDESGEDVLGSRAMYNISILDHLLAKEDERGDRIVSALANLSNDERPFLSAYFARGTCKGRLASGLAQKSARALNFLAEDPGVADSDRPSLISAAIEGMAAEVEYETGNALKTLLQQHYTTMPAFTSEAATTEHAGRVAGLLRKSGAVLPTIKDLGTLQRDAVVEACAYKMNRENIESAIQESTEISLDEIHRRSESVYRHALGNLTDYLDAVREAGGTSIRSAESFAIILTDASDAEPEDLTSLIRLSASECFIADLEDVPPATWPLLADAHRFPPSSANVAAYLREQDNVDTHLASLLAAERRIEPGDAGESEKAALAKRVLAASDVLTEPEVRVGLAESLDLEEHLPLEDVPPEGGRMVGLLIAAELIPDDAESFALTLDKGWTTREFAISKSAAFASFMSPQEVPVGDIPTLLASPTITESIKVEVVRRASAFTEGAGRNALAAVAEYALSKKIALEYAAVLRCARAGVASNTVLELLEGLPQTLPAPELSALLSVMGEPFALMASATGKRPHMKRSAAAASLGRRLVSVGLATSISDKNDDLIAIMKKPQTPY